MRKGNRLPMKVLALTDGSVLAASSLDAFDGLMHVDTHVPLAPLPVDLRKPDIVVIAFAEFPEFGLHPLFLWLERYKLVTKPRVVCLPPEVTKQYSAAVRPFADRVLPLPLPPAMMLDTVQRLDSRIPRIRKQGRNDTAATVQSTARTLIGSFGAERADPQKTVPRSTRPATMYAKHSIPMALVCGWNRSPSTIRPRRATACWSPAWRRSGRGFWACRTRIITSSPVARCCTTSAR